MRSSKRHYGYINDLTGRNVSWRHESHPMSVACPTCGAQAGEGCARSDGQRVSWLHRGRLRLARRDALENPPPEAKTKPTCPACGAKTTATKRAHRSPFGARCTGTKGATA